jgi:hypothetical protein
MFEQIKASKPVDSSAPEPDWSSVYDDLLATNQQTTDRSVIDLARQAADQIQRNGDIGQAAFDAIAREVRMPLRMNGGKVGQTGNSEVIDRINTELQARGMNCSLTIDARHRNWCKPYPAPASIVDISLRLSHSGDNAPANKFWAIRTISTPTSGGKARIEDYPYSSQGN